MQASRQTTVASDFMKNWFAEVCVPVSMSRRTLKDAASAVFLSGHVPIKLPSKYLISAAGHFDQRNFFWVEITAETHNRSKCGEQKTLEFSALNGTSAAPPPRPREHHKRERGGRA